MSISDNVVLGKHLESVASASKNYTDTKFANVSGGSSYNDSVSSDTTGFESALNTAFGQSDSVQPATGFHDVLNNIFRN